MLWGWDLLDALEIERSLLVGHSFGGMLAAEMAATVRAAGKKISTSGPRRPFSRRASDPGFFRDDTGRTGQSCVL